MPTVKSEKAQTCPLDGETEEVDGLSRVTARSRAQVLEALVHAGLARVLDEGTESGSEPGRILEFWIPRIPKAEASTYTK